MVRFALSVGLAGGVTAGLLGLVPRTLRAHTDVVGATTFTNFDVDFYFVAFYAVVILLPVTALALFLVLTRRASGRWLPATASRRLAAAAEPELTDGPSPIQRWAAQSARLALTGAVFGLEAAIAMGSQPGGFWKLEALAIAATGTAAFGLAIAWRRLRVRARPLLGCVAAVNALITPALFLGLVPVSMATTVTVLSSGVEHHYNWMPAWLGLLLTLLGLGLVGRSLTRASSEVDVRRVGRLVALFVAGSVAMFLLLAFLPGELGRIDMFHDGEGLVAARMAALGAFPWRDIIWAHGLLEDTYRSQFGLTLIDNSRWGGTAGYTLILSPLYLVSLYLLLAYLFRRNWPFLILSALILLGGTLLGETQWRWIFWPLILLLLAAMLRRPTNIRIAGFVAAMGLQAVIVPESVYAIPGCAAVVVLYEVYHFDRTRSLPASLRRTIGCGIAAVMFSAAFAAYLVSQHALGDFLYYYRIASAGRQYQGALRFGDQLATTLHPRMDRFAAIAPAVALLISFWYAAYRILNRIRFTEADWIMGAVALFVLLYYQKFLTRADAHVYHPYAVAVPLLLYIGYRVAVRGETWLRDTSWGVAVTRNLPLHPVGLALLLVAVLTFPGGFSNYLVQAPARYRAAAASEPWLATLGYATPAALNQSEFSDIQQVVQAYLGPNDSVFDFNNEPALYYYLLGYRPKTRYYHVELAMAQFAQADMISEIRRTHPKLIVFSNDRMGLPAWDKIPNMVRHYDVSQYILDNYRPLVNVQSQLIFVDKTASVPSPTALGLRLSQPVIVDNLYFTAQECDWGYTPNFFSVKPASVPGRGPVSLTVKRPAGAEGARSLVMELPPSKHWTDFRWLEIDNGRPFVDDSFALHDNSPDGRHYITFKTLPSSASHYLVRVGNCTPWDGYEATSLRLDYGQTEDITGVRLIP